MANINGDTDSVDHDIQDEIAHALSRLNKQRIHLSIIAAEGQDGENLSASRKIQDAQQAQEAVDALRKALYVFVGMSDEQAATFQILSTLLAPLELPEASNDDVQAWRDSRLRTTTDAEHSVQTTAINNHTNANVPVSGLSDSPAPSQAVNSDSNNSSLVPDPKPPKEQKIWSPDYAGVEFLTTSPTLVKLEDGTFVELRCDLCHGNGSWAHHKFNRGVRGFQSHFRQVHDDKTSAENVLPRCTYRVVSSHEVEQIKSGDSQIEFVSCQTKVNVGSGKEYIGNTTAVGPVTVKRAGHTVETLAAAAATTGQIQNTTPAASKKQRKNKKNAGPDTGSTTVAAGQIQTATPAAPKKQRRKKNAGTDSATPTAPPKKSNRVRDVTAPCLSNCLIVVQTTAEDGTDKYHELRCDVCHGNGSFGSGKLLEGVKGFKAHFRQIHHQQLLTADVLRRCSYREVPLREVQEIQSGNVNIGIIMCEGSPNVRPKTSYKNFNNVERT